MTKEEQIEDITNIIIAEQCSNLPHIDMGGRMFEVRGILPLKVSKTIAEQIYRLGYHK